jgi:hypothetical protein
MGLPEPRNNQASGRPRKTGLASLLLGNWNKSRKDSEKKTEELLSEHPDHLSDNDAKSYEEEPPKYRWQPNFGHAAVFGARGLPGDVSPPLSVPDLKYDTWSISSRGDNVAQRERELDRRERRLLRQQEAVAEEKRSLEFQKEMQELSSNMDRQVLYFIEEAKRMVQVSRRLAESIECTRSDHPVGQIRKVSNATNSE